MRAGKCRDGGGGVDQGVDGFQDVLVNLACVAGLETVAGDALQHAVNDDTQGFDLAFETFVSFCKSLLFSETKVFLVEAMFERVLVTWGCGHVMGLCEENGPVRLGE